MVGTQAAIRSPQLRGYAGAHPRWGHRRADHDARGKGWMVQCDSCPASASWSARPPGAWPEQMITFALRSLVVVGFSCLSGAALFER
jgi:hypothetical protein